MKFRTRTLFLTVALVAIFCSIASLVLHATRTRAIVSEDCPNGTRVRVVQDFSGEPFCTAIYFDDGDGKWRRYYYDHEDWYWGSAETTYLDGVLYIASGDRKITLDTISGECETEGSQLGKHTQSKSERIFALPLEPESD